MKSPVLKYQYPGSRVIKLSFVICLMTIVILPNNVFGKMSKTIFFSRDELSAMPRWCQCRILVQNQILGLSTKPFKNVPDSLMLEYNKWAKIVGKDVIRFTHHYCTGLNWINRYNRYYTSQYQGSERDRQFALKAALSEFKFMRGRLNPKHKLYYSMLMREAYVYSEQKNLIAAGKNYKEIFKLKPGYASAYVEYARLLNSVGKTEDAIKILQIGLKKTKGDKAIKQAMTAMEGAGANN